MKAEHDVQRVREKRKNQRNEITKHEKGKTIRESQRNHQIANMSYHIERYHGGASLGLVQQFFFYL